MRLKLAVFGRPGDEAESSESTLIYILESNVPVNSLFCGLKLKRHREGDVCHHQLHYRRYISVVFHTTEPTVKT